MSARRPRHQEQGVREPRHGRAASRTATRDRDIGGLPASSASDRALSKNSKSSTNTKDTAPAFTPKAGECRRRRCRDRRCALTGRPRGDGARASVIVRPSDRHRQRSLVPRKAAREQRPRGRLRARRLINYALEQRRARWYHAVRRSGRQRRGVSCAKRHRHFERNGKLKLATKPAAL